MVASHAAPAEDLACNPGMCPDWESNQRPFGSQASTQSTEPHQPGPINSFFRSLRIRMCLNDLILDINILQKRMVAIVGDSNMKNVK